MCYDCASVGKAIKSMSLSVCLPACLCIRQSVGEPLSSSLCLPLRRVLNRHVHRASLISTDIASARRTGHSRTGRKAREGGRETETEGERERGRERKTKGEGKGDKGREGKRERNEELLSQAWIARL